MGGGEIGASSSKKRPLQFNAFSLENGGRVKRELHTKGLSSHVEGSSLTWESPAGLQFPHEILLELEEPGTFVREIRMLLNQYKTPSRCVIFAGLPNGQTRRLGRGIFKDPRKLGFAKREIKCLEIRDTINFLHIIFEDCYTHEHNTHKQVQVSGLIVLGNPEFPVEICSGKDVINRHSRARSSSDLTMESEAKISNVLEQLRAVKSRVPHTSQHYQQAEHMERRMLNMKAAKEEAVEAEDYVRAGELKEELVKLAQCAMTYIQSAPYPEIPSSRAADAAAKSLIRGGNVENAPFQRLNKNPSDIALGPGPTRHKMKPVTKLPSALLNASEVDTFCLEHGHDDVYNPQHDESKMSSLEQKQKVNDDDDDDKHEPTTTIQGWHEAISGKRGKDQPWGSARSLATDRSDDSVSSTYSLQDVDDAGPIRLVPSAPSSDDNLNNSEEKESSEDQLHQEQNEEKYDSEPPEEDEKAEILLNDDVLSSTINEEQKLQDFVNEGKQGENANDTSSQDGGNNSHETKMEEVGQVEARGGTMPENDNFTVQQTENIEQDSKVVRKADQQKESEDRQREGGGNQHSESEEESIHAGETLGPDDSITVGRNQTCNGEATIGGNTTFGGDTTFDDVSSPRPSENQTFNGEATIGGTSFGGDTTFDDVSSPRLSQNKAFNGEGTIGDTSFGGDTTFDDVASPRPSENQAFDGEDTIGGDTTFGANTTFGNVSSARCSELLESPRESEEDQESESDVSPRTDEQSRCSSVNGAQTLNGEDSINGDQTIDGNTTFGGTKTFDVSDGLLEAKVDEEVKNSGSKRNYDVDDEERKNARDEDECERERPYTPSSDTESVHELCDQLRSASHSAADEDWEAHEHDYFILAVEGLESRHETCVKAAVSLVEVLCERYSHYSSGTHTLNNAEEGDNLHLLVSHACAQYENETLTNTTRMRLSNALKSLAGQNGDGESARFVVDILKGPVMRTPSDSLLLVSCLELMSAYLYAIGDGGNCQFVKAEMRDFVESTVWEETEEVRQSMESLLRKVKPINSNQA